LANFGVAVTYETFITLGLILAVPACAGNSTFLSHLYNLIQTVPEGFRLAYTDPDRFRVIQMDPDEFRRIQTDQTDSDESRWIHTDPDEFR